MQQCTGKVCGGGVAVTYPSCPICTPSQKERPSRASRANRQRHRSNETNRIKFYENDAKLVGLEQATAVQGRNTEGGDLCPSMLGRPSCCPEGPTNISTPSNGICWGNVRRYATISPNEVDSTNPFRCDRQCHRRRGRAFVVAAAAVAAGGPVAVSTPVPRRRRVHCQTLVWVGGGGGGGGGGQRQKNKTAVKVKASEKT